MAKRKLRTEVIRTVTLSFAYDPLTEGIPSEAQLREDVEHALDGYEDEQDGKPLRYTIAGVKTATKRVPVEQQD